MSEHELAVEAAQEYIDAHRRVGDKLIGGAQHCCRSTKDLAVRFIGGENLLSENFCTQAYWERQLASMMNSFERAQNAAKRDSRAEARRTFGTSWGNLDSASRRMVRNAYGEDAAKYFD